MRVKRIGNHTLPIPSKAYDSACYDLQTSHDATLPPDSVTKIPTGFAWELPYGCVGKIWDRSSSAGKGIMTLGGVVDWDYRGEVFVSLYNFDSQPFEIKAGDKIAQMAIISIYRISVLVEVDQLSETTRGDKGFGSSG